MTIIMKRFTKGVVLKGESSDVTENAEGSLFQNSSELRLKAYIEGAVRQVVTNSQSQVLTNKTIDADNNSVSNIQTSNLKSGTLNTDTSLAGASNTQIPSALAAKTYSDTIGSTATSNLSSHSSTSSGVHGVTGSIVGTTDTQTLTNKTITGADIRTPIRSDVKQDTKANLTTYALTASNGQLVFATDTKEMFQVVDTLLVAVGGGEGIGGVDILFTQTFETAALTDFTQTGLSLSTSDPLHGEISALLTHQAGTSPTNDQSFKQVIPVDRKFRGETMTLRLNAKSNASAGNVTINIYDETNAANIVASEQLELSNDTSGAISRVGFTIPESCASISYTITALPEAGSPVSRIDDIICELASTALLETAVEVPVVTAWQGYTPTFQGFGTPTNVEFEWRQVGENVEVRGKFVSGTSTAVEARVGLPAGLTSAGTSLIPSLQVVGKANAAVNNTTNFGGMSVLIEPSTAYITFGRESSTINGTTKANGDAIIAASGVISFFASVPCSGLSATTTKTIPLTQSGLVQEADSVLYAAGNGGQAITVNVTDIPFTAISSEGNDISFNGSSVTALSNGIYSFDIGILFTTSLARRVSIYVNNAVIYETASATDTSLTSNITLKLNSGDIVKFRVSGNGGTLNNASQFHYLSVTKQGSLKQVSVNPNSKITIPTSELRMEGASTRGSTATAIVRFDNVAKLRGDAFTVESDSVLGTRITMKKAGKLDVSATLAVNSSPVTMSITKNQSSLTTNPTNASEFIAAEIGTASSYTSISGSTFVEVGDIIRLCSTNNPTAGAGNNLSLSFQEQDISVSVTNTLPQFSESDSSVRVDTANGYGSTWIRTRRFSNITENLGSDIAYEDSPTEGAKFTVRTSGIYSISYTDSSLSTSDSIGITRNGTNTFVGSNSASAILALQQKSASDENNINCSWIGYLVAGDVIRPGTDNSGAASNNARVSFTISKVGKPNVTGVDVTPFVNVPQPDSEFINKSGAGVGSTNTNIVTFNSNTFKNTLGSKGILSYSNSSTLGDSFTALKKCTVRVSFSCSTLSLSNAGYEARLLKNDITGAPSSTLNYSSGIISSGAGPEVDKVSLQGSYQLEAGDVLRFFVASSAVFNLSGTTFMSIEAEALSDQILTAPETFSTDTAALVYAPSSTYTLSTLANAPVGTYITFTYAANTNTRTQTTTRPTQTDADMNANGMLIYTRAFNATSTAAQPAAIAIQIGKGLKGIANLLYNNTSKSLAGSLDNYVDGVVSIGLRTKNYNEKTGVLVLDAGIVAATITSSLFVFEDGSSQTSGYLVINASKNPALTGLGLGTVAASVRSTSGQTFNDGSTTTPTWDSAKVYDTHNAFNASTSTFTAPETGYYVSTISLSFNIPASTRFQIGFNYVVNGTSTVFAPALAATQNATNSTTGYSSSHVVYLKKGDSLQVTAFQESGAARTLVTQVGRNTLTIAKTSIGTGN